MEVKDYRDVRVVPDYQRMVYTRFRLSPRNLRIETDSIDSGRGSRATKLLPQE